MIEPESEERQQVLVQGLQVGIGTHESAQLVAQIHQELDAVGEAGEAGEQIHPSRSQSLPQPGGGLVQAPFRRHRLAPGGDAGFDGVPIRTVLRHQQRQHLAALLRVARQPGGGDGRRLLAGLHFSERGPNTLIDLAAELVQGPSAAVAALWRRQRGKIVADAVGPAGEFLVDGCHISSRSWLICGRAL